MKRIHYSNPKVASYLLLGIVFLIAGFSQGFLFFLLGAILLFMGLRVNQHISDEH